MSEAALTVIEFPAFVAHSAAIWNDDERFAFIDYIARNPTVGVIVPGTGGVRKVRWTAGGRGKRSGARVIYYFHSLALPLFLLTVYTKSVQEDLSQRQKAEMRNLVKTLAETYGKRKIR